MLEKNGRKETGMYGVGGRQSYDNYLKNDDWKRYVMKPLEWHMLI